MQLVGGVERDAVLVDDRAIGVDQGQRFVLALNANNALEYRAVKPGRLVDGLRVISGTIGPEDVIVIEGLQRLRPGIQVTPKRTTMRGAAPPPASQAEGAASARL